MAVDDASPSLGDLLREHRRAAGLTQEELAERAGLSPRSISEMERGGAHIPRRDTVALLVQALGLAGDDRESFEGLIDRGRRGRGRPTLVRTSVNQAPLSMVRAGERPKHNLPRSLTSFVGREQELTELARVLPTVPLLTLVGAGGVGKSRLAEELVRAHLDSYADGSWIVELAGVTHPSLVPDAVAAGVGLRDLHGRSVTNTLIDYLRPKQLLLVLNNCEHLVSACADLVAHLLRTCPWLQILATSREPLAIEGEVTWRVPPLELPELQRPQPAEQIVRSAAVRLFSERARAANNMFLLTDDNAPVIARICVALDGIPLALELAAARTRMLTVEQLEKRLEHDSSVLGRATRRGLPQHQTLRATLDWSYELLGDPERVLLRRLAVFACGWTLELAEVVCSGGAIDRADVLELLALLVDKSMALVDTREKVTRYRLLEPIRQYALERLEASGEASSYRRRRAEALLQLVQTAPDDPAGPDEVASLERVEVEYDNIRAALGWALANQECELALRASSALFRFWERRGHFQEGCGWLEQALASAVDASARDRARALNALANLCWRGGEAERGLLAADKALALSREEGDMRELASALLNLGMIAYLRHEHELAVGRLEESVPYARQAGHPQLLSLVLAFLGRALLWVNGPLDRRVAEVVVESLALAEAAQARYASSHALATLGDIRWGQGHAHEALSLWRRALVVVSELTDRRGIAGCIERLAFALAAAERLDEAAWLFGAAEAQHKALGIELRADAEADHAHFVAVTREQLGDARAAAWADGQTATVGEAIMRALAGTRRLPLGGVQTVKATAGASLRAALYRPDAYEYSSSNSDRVG